MDSELISCFCCSGVKAHVRGHQVRKKYKTIIWSVGILEKVILRWRRKGSGLRGFRPDAVAKCPSAENMPRKDDDYDFLKEGRKQTEERLQKALSRVKSMAQYPEARAQYRRLLTVAEGFRETEVLNQHKYVISLYSLELHHELNRSIYQRKLSFKTAIGVIFYTCFEVEHLSTLLWQKDA